MQIVSGRTVGTPSCIRTGHTCGRWEGCGVKHLGEIGSRVEVREVERRGWMVSVRGEADGVTGGGVDG